MLLCSEHTASTADSTQNKMILYHLFENLCLQQRRKEERGCLQEEHVGGLLALGLEQRGGRCICNSTTNSPGEMAHVYRRSSPPKAMPTEKHSRHLHPSSYAGETGCSSAGSWQLSRMPTTGFCFAFLKEKLRQK